MIEKVSKLTKVTLGLYIIYLGFQPILLDLFSSKNFFSNEATYVQQFSVLANFLVLIIGIIMVFHQIKIKTCESSTTIPTAVSFDVLGQIIIQVFLSISITLTLKNIGVYYGTLLESTQMPNTELLNLNQKYNLMVSILALTFQLVLYTKSHMVAAFIFKKVTVTENT